MAMTKENWREVDPPAEVGLSDYIAQNKVPIMTPFKAQGIHQPQ